PPPRIPAGPPRVCGPSAMGSTSKPTGECGGREQRSRSGRGASVSTRRSTRAFPPAPSSCSGTACAANSSPWRRPSSGPVARSGSPTRRFAPTSCRRQRSSSDWPRPGEGRPPLGVAVGEGPRPGCRTATRRYNTRVLITISGLPGSGKTTVAQLVARTLGLEHVYAGDIFRKQAEAQGLTLEEYQRRAETDHSIDRALDDQMRSRAAQGNAVLEGRLAAFMAEAAGQTALRVFLDA